MTAFHDGKEADALRTIGEVSEGLGIKPHVLRYWEQQFPMLKPLKRSGGRRYYRPQDIALLERIDRLVNQDGYTLKGASAAIASGKDAGADIVTDDRAETQPKQSIQPKTHAELHLGLGEEKPANDILPQLKAIRARLAALVEG